MGFHELLEIQQGDRRQYHDDVSIIIISLEGKIWRSSQWTNPVHVLVINLYHQYCIGSIHDAIYNVQRINQSLRGSSTWIFFSPLVSQNQSQINEQVLAAVYFLILLPSSFMKGLYMILHFRISVLILCVLG